MGTCYFNLGPATLHLDSNPWTLNCLSNHFKDFSVVQISDLAIPNPHTTLTFAAIDWTPTGTSSTVFLADLRDYIISNQQMFLEYINGLFLLQKNFHFTKENMGFLPYIKFN